jgi:hypothetical protein
MDVLIDYLGAWGLGDLLCSDPMVLGLLETHGPATRIWLRGKAGNLAYHPMVRGMASPGQRFDRVVEVRLFTHMDRAEYGRLEALPSLIDHMCSYAGVRPSDRRPRLHLHADDLAARSLLLPRTGPRIAICADHLDPLRHWPVERGRTVARVLHEAGADVVGIGVGDTLGCGLDLVGKLSMRQTAAVLGACDLFVGNNSGPFHYAQAAGTPCVTLFSLATPSRFVHPGATVHVVQADGLPCLHCMTRCFAAMQRSGCIASPRGRCMTEIGAEQVLDAIDHALRSLPAPGVARTSTVGLDPPPATVSRAAGCSAPTAP